jgi:glycosyltransferase involved in cell wall biosynthesis
VLWVTAEPPDRDLGGGNIRQANLLIGLARDADVHLALAGTLRDQAVRAAVAGLREVPLPEPPALSQRKTVRRVRDLRRALVDMEPPEVGEARAQRAALQTLLRDAAGFDAVHVEHGTLAALVPTPRPNRWSLTLQQLESRRWEHAAARETGRQRWLLQRMARRTRRWEQGITALFDVVIVTSAEDQDELARPCVVVANGVDTERFFPAPLIREPRIVLPGSLHWRPNVLGAAWFCDEVLPRVQALVPGTELEIAGREPVPEVRALAGRPGVTLSANVPSMLPHLHRARVCVVPIFVGSGTRVKALDAMAAGRPVVGTTIGLEGLGVEPGVHAEVADEPGAMAAALARVLTDDSHAQALADAGRALVVERFSWDRVTPVFNAAILGT